MAIDAYFYAPLPVFAYLLYVAIGRSSFKAGRFACYASLILIVCSSLIRRRTDHGWIPINPTINSVSYPLLYDSNILSLAGVFAFGGIIGLLEIPHVRVLKTMAACVLVAAVGMYACGLPLTSELSIALACAGLSAGHIPRLNAIVHSKAVQVAAEYSYSFYLLHRIVMILLKDVRPKLPFIPSFLSEYGMLVIATAPFAWALHVWIEKPLLKLK